MKRVGIIAALAMLLVALSATTAQGAAHFTGAEPVCTPTASGTTVNCTASEIAGVGNKDARATLVVTASQTVNCRNPGGNVVRPHTHSVSGSDDSGVLEAKNGKLQVPALSASAGPLGPVMCPNPNWTPEPVGPVTTSFTYTIEIGNRVFFELPA
jgi:hypothetical protein